MYCQFKLRDFITKDEEKRLKKHHAIQWNQDYGYRQLASERKTRSEIGKYNGICFEIVNNPKYPDSPILFVSGSIHKYKNSGEHNCDRSTLSDSVENFYDLFYRFQLNIRKMRVQMFEIGVNSFLDFDPDYDLFSRFIVYNGAGGSKKINSIKRAEAKQLSEGLRFDPSKQYHLKVYRKAANVIRFEAHVDRMQKVKNIPIRSILDLLDPTNVTSLVKMLLLDEIDKILFDEDITKDSRNQNDFEKYLLARNERTWLDLNPGKKSTCQQRKELKYRKNALKKWYHRFLQMNATHSIGSIFKEAVLRELKLCNGLSHIAFERLAELKSGAYLLDKRKQGYRNQPNYNSIEDNMVGTEEQLIIDKERENSNFIKANNGTLSGKKALDTLIEEKTFEGPDSPMKPATQVYKRYTNRRVRLSHKLFDLIEKLENRVLTSHEKHTLKVLSRNLLMIEDKNGRERFLY